MAKKSSEQVLLGFLDEFVSEKYNTQLDFTTNKVGGSPDPLPNISKLDNPKCPLCNLTRPLVIQIYAPLENSGGFHRTLYLFGCINPKCWGSNESWTCLRIEAPNENEKIEDNRKSTPPTVNWCSEEANDWGDEEANNWGEKKSLDFQDSEEVQISEDFEKMNIEEEKATAEMDLTSPEDKNIILQSSSFPFTLDDIVEESILLPPLPNESSSHPEFASYFISVWEDEVVMSQEMEDSHIKDLLQKYEQQNEKISLKTGKSSEKFEEKYEKSSPAHGDKLFQKFLTKIKENPGQILRYNREGKPLPIDLLEEPRKCQNCQGPMVFEFQLVSTLISKLRLTTDMEENVTRLDFGTVLVYTCKNSCWSETDSFRTEHVVLQMEVC